MKRSEPLVKQPQKRKHEFSACTRLLTATLLPTHFVAAGGGWSLADNGFDLYRARVRCIGSRLADCGAGEAVSLDLQPLSTRLALMCKLLIVIQGACVERAGPPRLVQDRCVQTRDAGRLAASRGKSFSCETLLDETGECAASSFCQC